MSGAGFFIVANTLTALLAHRGANMPEEVADELLDDAMRIQQYAYENAPWLDRTGMARAGLDVDVTQEGKTVSIELFHTVDYGLWLEIIQSGRFAIIMPTLEAFAGDVFSSVGAEYVKYEGGDI